MDKMMNAMLIEAFGGPDVLRWQKISVPKPREGEVLLKIRAASVNPVDYKIRSGKYPAVKANMLPYVLGRDVCGDVEACGPGVTAFAEGAPLYAFLGIDRGGYAEYVVVKESEASSKPTVLDHPSAAAVPLAGLTAWQGLFRYGGLQSGQRVLIHAGSGGVGHFAIQFAKARGAHVITTVSEQSVDFVRKLGADEVIDYKANDFTKQAGTYDVIFDCIGNQSYSACKHVLQGRRVHVTVMPGVGTFIRQFLNPLFGAKVFGLITSGAGDGLEYIKTLIETGKLKPVIDKTYPFAEVAAAQEYSKAGRAKGKIVLEL